jgi:outer membrane murein-binding lipoprotein Lpp
MEDSANRSRPFCAILNPPSSIFSFPLPASRILLLAALLLLATLAGCTGTPNQANIDLRKQIQQLQEQVSTLDQQHRADRAEIAAMRQSTPTQPSLPSARLERLFTTHGLKFGRLTAGYDSDRNRPGDEGVKVYVVPTDQDGQPLKAAGSFTIDLFDLAQTDAPHIGHWAFDVDQAKKNWYGAFLDYTYAFTLPWQQAPKHADLTARVTFTDELTQLPFNAQTTVKVHPPPPDQSPATAPQSRPARTAER